MQHPVGSRGSLPRTRRSAAPVSTGGDRSSSVPRSSRISYARTITSSRSGDAPARRPDAQVTRTPGTGEADRPAMRHSIVGDMATGISRKYAARSENCSHNTIRRDLGCCYILYLPADGVSSVCVSSDEPSGASTVDNHSPPGATTERDRASEVTCAYGFQTLASHPAPSSWRH